ncbi:MAG: phosphoribosylaminoimidazolesuccinocarboxamide synthase [Candidatus Omnitrophica bacterium]|nr:phosphoribosylaminoimidazolesuccinocarboxamide synthase [Candidatus Omnitrophota bacterium]
MSDKKTVWETKLPLPLVGRGKVRDIYAVGEDKLLIVTTDRLSAFDVVLPNPIPDKGKVLTQISVFWFDFFKNTTPHHLLTADVSQMGLPQDIVQKFGADLQGRSMLVKKTKPLSVECVVRGYVTGSGWKDYLKTGAVCGHVLPKGLKQCEKLAPPIFTPATKETSGHDINIDFNEAVKREGEAVAKKIEKISIELYQKGADFAATKGILIADTKFEFGILNGEVILIDEALTPDSSRFWPKDQYEVGHDQPSYDKQIVRNYLLDIKWDQKPPAPELPAEVVEKTSQAYRDVYERLVGKKLSSS